MEIKKTSLEISNIKYPLIFLFNLIQYKNELGDTNLSIILRLFLKHHITIALDFNLKAIFENDFGDFKLCRAVLIDFYSIIKKQTSLIFILKKWFDAYDKKSFWLLNVEEQLERLTNMKHIFYGIYDCSKGGVPLFNKLRTDNIINNIDTKETIKERLIQLLNLFGMKLFKILDIKLITEEEYESNYSSDIIVYLLSIYEKFNNVLEQTIKLFDSFNFARKQLFNLLNPVNITIRSLSEPSYEDMDIYIAMMLNTK